MDNSRTNRLCVNVGGVLMGGGHPVAVQSMTNTDTADIAATVAQISALARAGSELVRITVNDRDAASAVPRIRDALMAANVDVPLVGDFHFNGHKLLAEHAGCAESLSKYRVNPGNVGKGATRHTQFAKLVEIACKHDKVIRIGVNWGSLDPTMIERIMDENAKLTVPGSANDVMREAMVMSAIESAELAKSVGLPADRIVLSCKVSGVQDLVAIYRDLADRCNYPLHLGLTEAGMGTKGVVASTAALAILLQEGIGDTIRVSLTPEPGGDRTQEVVVAQQILQTMGIRAYTPFVVACPGCGRTTSTVFQHLAKDIESHIKLRMPEWKQKYVGVESMTIAVMGCVVNGPGESKHANIGISLPGTGEEPTAPVYVDGARTVTLKGDSLATQFADIVDQYVDGKFRKKD